MQDSVDTQKADGLWNHVLIMIQTPRPTPSAPKEMLSPFSASKSPEVPKGSSVAFDCSCSAQVNWVKAGNLA
jgi:hypothetical protein